MDEALQRITAAAAGCIQPAPLPRGHEREEAAEDEQEEPHASAVWRFFEERATEATMKRNLSADTGREILALRSPFCRKVQTH